MRTGIVIFLLALIALLPCRADAQEENGFSEDPVLFVAELEYLFRQTPVRQRQAVNTLVNNIKQSFNTGIIHPDNQREMIKAANLMQDFRLRPFPHFFAYFSAAMACHNDARGQNNYVSWNKSVLKLIAADNPRRLESFLEQSELFFRQKLLYNTGAVQWRVYGGEWAIAPDSIPAFMISDAMLTCYASRDSLNVFHASGSFFPLNNEWRGSKGRINWSRAGFPESEVYADFSHHLIALNNSEFSADSAWLSFPDYFGRRLGGNIVHRVVSGARPATTTYPRFTSYDFVHEVRDVFPGIDYMGGFALEGSRVMGFGKERENAYLVIKRNGEPIIRLVSHSFVIRDDRITSQRASFCLYFENDSIYHPGLQMRYMDAEKELMLLRSGEGIAQSPYFNSYHHLDMTFEALYWNLNSAEMTFGAMRGMSRESAAIFESANFFTQPRFNRIQGADAQHPLIVINDYVNQSNSAVFYHEDLAIHMNLALNQVSAMLISLANLGFLQYSPDDGRVVVKDRIDHYIDAVNNRSDYDVIRIQSQVDGLVNAKLNLETFDLSLFGVPEVFLSRTQRVFVFPQNSRITMKKGLDFIFGGQIHAGYFQFYAEECAFLYDDFKLNLTRIDSLSFDVPVLDDQRTREELERVRTVISDISGDLLIDHPSNKSGRKKYPRYPIFDSKTDSYVYFDEPHIQGGVYDREDFYYHILPFTIDSLTNFTTVGMSFNGYLHSGNIFPDIEEPLRVQPDFSLGFVRDLTGEGLPLYNGRAHAFVELSVSHQGLRGGGKIDYLTSVMYSGDFIFHPDSVMSELYEFILEPSIGDVSHPGVFAKDVSQRWIIDDDRMVLKSTANVPFEMYNNQLVHKGTLIYRSTGLFGSGEAIYADATFRSTNFNFLHDQFGADKSVFMLKSPAFGMVFRANGYGFEYDLDMRQGRFHQSGSNAFTEFPLNRYHAYMDLFRWETDYEELYLSMESESPVIFPLSGSETSGLEFDRFKPNFFSKHPAQDSLRFAAGAARFDLREYTLGIQEVPFIEVADAAVFPIDGNVEILRNAEMRPLHGANLIAGTENRFHNLYNVNATINGRSDYSATGVYDYTDVTGKTQTIFFNRIEIDSLGNSYGMAHISDLGFSLSPYFDFIGNIRFNAKDKDFYYDGGFRIRHNCSEGNPRWVRFQGEIDKQKVMLPILEPTYDIHGEKLFSSVLFSPISNRVYPGFLLGKQYPSDQELIVAHGKLHMNPENNTYVIEKAVEAGPPAGLSGRLMLNIDRCILSAEGLINFGHDFGRMSMHNSGSIDHYLIPDSTVLRLFSVIDFFFDDQALNMIQLSLNEAALQGMDPNNESFNKGLRRFLSDEDAQRLLSELNLYGTFRRFPRELSQTLILSDVKMKWNNNTRSFTSYGHIGIAALNSQLVNRYVEGHIEIVRRRAGDILNIYIQPADNEWYFFTYSAGVMQAISSNEGFNEQLLGLREDRRTLRTRGDEEPYQFIISTIQQRNAFLRRLRSN